MYYIYYYIGGQISRKYKTGHLVAVQPERGGIESGEVEKGGGERICITDLKVP